MMNVKKKKIFQPIILTIPDDAVVFSILDMKEEISKKIIMENYINFYCFKDYPSDIAYFRFDNFKDYESIEGLDRCYIPIDIVKKYCSNIEVIIHLLEEGYVISMPVSKGSITFYGEEAEGTHRVMIYDLDKKRKILLCKDFDNRSFIGFEVSFAEMRSSLMEYYRSYARDSDGLLALKISTSVIPQIEYSKVFSEFQNLKQELVSQRAAYGLGAVDLYLNEIKGYSSNANYIASWYVVANYLREASKLMNIRYHILKEEGEKYHIKDFLSNKSAVDKLLYDTNILFFKIGKMLVRNDVLPQTVFDELESRICVCKEDFKKVAEFFCDNILLLEKR